MFRRSTWPIASLVLAALAACTDPSSPVPTPIDTRGAAVVVARQGDRLATIEHEGFFPALYLQDPDGKSRVRVRFSNVHDPIDGNYPAELLPVDDAHILALGPAKWSPDGQQLAIVVTLGYDQSQVVVMNADGRNIRTASPNSQIILGDIDWAPDSRSIAYAMSTLPNAGGVDVFVTDLTRDAVVRVTHEGRVSVFDEYRFDARGKGLWMTQYEGRSEDDVNRVSRVYHVALDGTKVGVPEKIVGNAQGITRDGRFAIVLRHVRDDDMTSEFARVSLTGRDEELLLARGDLQYAELLEGDDAAILVGANRETGMQGFNVLGIHERRDDRGMLHVSPYVASLAYLRASR